MIIDTNGFEIGDEVWCTIKQYGKEFKPFYSIIYSFIINNEGLQAITPLGKVKINGLFNCNCEQECQLACDRLNGINHD